MKNFSLVLILILTMCFASCVNRIDIPEDEDSMLYIHLEMLKDQNLIVADFKTTNNLNGTFPIRTPEIAEIKVKEILPPGFDDDNEIEFHFDADLQKYVSDLETNKNFLSYGAKYTLEASIENSDLEAISSTTIVPYRVLIEKSELITEGTFEDVDGNTYWQGSLGINFQLENDLVENYGHLQLDGFQTTLETLTSGETVYVHHGNGKQFFELVDVVVGSSAVTDIIQREGFFIDFDELEDNYIEITLRSPFANTLGNQVTDYIDFNLISVSQEHYDHHISLHNIKKSQGNIFEENALYSSNIEKGLGLFSSCVEVIETIQLR